MFAKKKRTLVSYSWSSHNNGSGYGHYTRDWYGNIDEDEFSVLVDSAKEDLKHHFKDNTDYFNIIILNIVRLDRI